MTEPAYYFGRGSANCIGAQVVHQCYINVFVGDGKGGDRGLSARLHVYELRKLSDFFRSLHECYGHFCLVPIYDDPHDEWHIVNFDWTQEES